LTDILIEGSHIKKSRLVGICSRNSVIEGGPGGTLQLKVVTGGTCLLKAVAVGRAPLKVVAGGTLWLKEV